MSRRNRRGRSVHGILLLDKPAGGSSNHALQRVKRIFNARKAGHTGSLDPLATGMLPICFGEATKLSAFLLDADKGYETTLQLGVTTNSADSDGEVLETRPLPDDLSHERFEQVCARFLGPLQQIPPMVSAIKIDGQRLYKLAREGKEVDRPPRSIVIHDLYVLEFSGQTARLAVRSSKGTYIRSLVTDIGDALGCGAHVTKLRRTHVSPFEQYPMTRVDVLESIVAESNYEDLAQDHVAMAKLDALLLPLDAGLQHLPSAVINQVGLGAFGRGQSANCLSSSATSRQRESGLFASCRVYDEAGRMVGLGELSESCEQVAPRRVLQWD